MQDRCAGQPALNANALRIDSDDNVAVALADIAAGSAVILSVVAGLQAGAPRFWRFCGRRCSVITRPFMKDWRGSSRTSHRPITAVFVMGVSWRKASGRGAFITLVSGAGMGAAIFILDFFGKPVSRWLARSGWQAAHTALDAAVRCAVKDFMLTL